MTCRLPGQPTGNVHRGLRRSLVALMAVALLAICVPTAKAQTAA